MRRIARFFSGPVMIAAGINHFVMPATYDAIIPRGLSNKRQLTYASGVAETVSALGTMFPSTRRAAGKALITTLLAVFPANVSMALHPDRYPRVPGGRRALIARLPLQALFVYWVWVATQRPGAQRD